MRSRAGWSPAPHARGDRGQATVLVVVLVVGVAVASALVAGRLGALAADRAAARTAADAGALAGAVAGEPEARRVVEANGAALVELRREGTRVVVRARVRGAEATAAAEPVRCGPGEVRGCRRPPP